MRGPTAEVQQQDIEALRGVIERQTKVLMEILAVLKSALPARGEE